MAEHLVNLANQSQSVRQEVANVGSLMRHNANAAFVLSVDIHKCSYPIILLATYRVSGGRNIIHRHIIVCNIADCVIPDIPSPKLVFYFLR